jgi:hypothetical protein
LSFSYAARNLDRIVCHCWTCTQYLYIVVTFIHSVLTIVVVWCGDLWIYYNIFLFYNWRK